MPKMPTYHSTAPIGKCIHQLLVVQAFRPDRLTAMGSKFVAKVMGEAFQQEAETELDLGTIVNTEVKDESFPSLKEDFCHLLPSFNSIFFLLLFFFSITQVKSNTPVLLCSVTGYDASSRVDDLATQQGKQCTRIAIGSAEGFNLAEKAISSASKSGR